ncbi:PepSY domain-containing protein [Mesorhizobium sp. Mes31]|uniref:PepSY domain-containing protein n=1 Tax=Mesorhizobium sp. Mes31 TaxID=2926017 RepID=UPI0021188313|nr:PepSY domain-containing protein [Mesorhizobium sp. Mes31]
MKTNLILAGALVATALGAAGAGTALANSHGVVNEMAETQSIMSAKVTAVQAAQAAETKVSGKVASVAFEGENGKPFYQVEVVTADGQQHSVAVDAATGEVTQMASNQEDEHSGQNGDENGQENGGENETGENAQQ